MSQVSSVVVVVVLVVVVVGVSVIKRSCLPSTGAAITESVIKLALHCTQSTTATATTTTGQSENVCSIYDPESLTSSSGCCVVVSQGQHNSQHFKTKQLLLY